MIIKNKGNKKYCLKLNKSSILETKKNLLFNSNKYE